VHNRYILGESRVADNADIIGLNILFDVMLTSN